MARQILHLPNRQSVIRKRANPGFVSDFLEIIGLDTFRFFDDFEGDEVGGSFVTGGPGKYQTSVSGAGAAAAIATGTVNGVINMAAGATDNGHSALSLGLHFRGDRNVVFVCSLELDNIGAVKVEAGLTDVVAGTDTGAVNDLSAGTPSFNATDFVGWVFDTDDTSNWQCVGVKAGTAATKIEPTTGFGQGDGDAAPDAATQEHLIVALLDDVAYFYRANPNGEVTFSQSNIMSAAVTKTVLLTPWLFVQARSANARTMKVDYWGAWQRRTT
jgi:hypothetical protein